jgi:hypothetical protein
MSRRLETALDESLTRLKNGEALESCLRRFPDLRDELEPLLQVAAGLSQMYERTAPAEEAVARARKRFMAEVYERRSARLSRPQRRWFWAPVLQRGFATAAIVTALIVFLLGGTGIVSANSLPGDPLYGVKLASENVRIWFTPDLEDRLLLRDYYESLRVAEVKEVMEKGRETQVSFSGVVERIEGDTLIVQGIPVQLPAIKNAEQPVPGTVVRIIAETRSDGTVAANSVDIKVADHESPYPDQVTPVTQPAPDTATPTLVVPPATATATATETARSPDRPSHKVTATATASATALPTTTKTEPATATVQASKTATVAPSATSLSTMTPSPTASPMPTGTSTPIPQPRDIRVRIEGRIDEIASDYWRVNGQRINLRSSTEINESAATAQVGGWATVQAVKKPDGTLYAQQIIVVRGPEQTPVIEEFSGVIEVIESDHWVVAGRRIDIAAETIVEGQPKLGLLAHVQAELKPDGGFVAKTIKVEPDSQNTVQIEGIIEKLEEDFWIVAGQEIWLDENTEIHGTPTVGAIAKVEAVVRADGKHWALVVEIQVEEKPTEAPTATIAPTDATPEASETPQVPTSQLTVEPATLTPTISATSGVEPTSTPSATMEPPMPTNTETTTVEATSTSFVARDWIGLRQ